MLNKFKVLVEVWNTVCKCLRLRSDWRKDNTLLRYPPTDFRYERVKVSVSLT